MGTWSNRVTFDEPWVTLKRGTRGISVLYVFSYRLTNSQQIPYVRHMERKVRPPPMWRTNFPAESLLTSNPTRRECFQICRPSMYANTVWPRTTKLGTISRGRSIILWHRPRIPTKGVEYLGPFWFDIYIYRVYIETKFCKVNTLGEGYLLQGPSYPEPYMGGPQGTTVFVTRNTYVCS